MSWRSSVYGLFLVSAGQLTDSSPMLTGSAVKRSLSTTTTRRGPQHPASGLQIPHPSSPAPDTLFAPMPRQVSATSRGIRHTVIGRSSTGRVYQVSKVWTQSQINASARSAIDLRQRLLQGTHLYVLCCWILSMFSLELTASQRSQFEQLHGGTESAS